MRLRLGCGCGSRAARDLPHWAGLPQVLAHPAAAHPGSAKSCDMQRLGKHVHRTCRAARDLPHWAGLPQVLAHPATAHTDSAEKQPGL